MTQTVTSRRGDRNTFDDIRWCEWARAESGCWGPTVLGPKEKPEFNGAGKPDAVVSGVHCQAVAELSGAQESRPCRRTHGRGVVDWKGYSEERNRTQGIQYHGGLLARRNGDELSALGGMMSRRKGVFGHGGRKEADERYNYEKPSSFLESI